MVSETRLWTLLLEILSIMNTSRVIYTHTRDSCCELQFHFWSSIGNIYHSNRLQQKVFCNCNSCQLFIKLVDLVSVDCYTSAHVALLPNWVLKVQLFRSFRSHIKPWSQIPLRTPYERFLTIYATVKNRLYGVRKGICDQGFRDHSFSSEIHTQNSGIHSQIVIQPLLWIGFHYDLEVNSTPNEMIPNMTPKRLDFHSIALRE